ncbi:radical SAM protein [Dissulfurirhabdus thermomarina]|uniref:Radical SAM protein n=1 Tax=Dissulfurirhabdus thermomarina TaxID=1765737 RepID=A0A6N9TJZ6_DISTH|nr:radical SAM protein [Dissulfurirhabdus thermomarina]NDY41399.1 radical SAM protein [Dissulfurirhabdus thermomarina]NMX23585.1 radical SAM protein [Dissulfurirhabdus thermomarina]
MKVLFLHVPKFNNFYKPIGDFIWINYMPMGLLAIADFVRRHGFEVEVIHLGVEWVEDRGLRLETLLDDPAVAAVGMSLHWHYQAYDVMAAARRIKEVRPDVFVFAGGYTASFFHDEIVRDFPQVDAVVRGDGEIPVLRLLETLQDGGSLEDVPNLTWREGPGVRTAEACYVGDAETVSGLNYTNFSLLRHAPTYVRYIGLPFFYAKHFSPEENFRRFTIRSPLLPLAVGRGCPFNCTWCGGAQVPQQRRISRRTGFVWRDPAAVIQDIKRGLAAGYRTLHTATDPEPVEQEYFVDLWRRIRREGIEADWMFECNGLPSDRFIDEFHKTFPGPDSIIAVSPECGNEDLRFRHKGPAFTTEAFFEKMDRIDRMGISTEIFFSYGLPGENEDLLEDTVRMRRRIIRRYRHVRGLRTLSIEMEPGAPWQMEPERFGIVTDRRTFRDFHDAHADADRGTYTTFGYYIPDYFERPLDPERPYDDFARRLQRIKCRRLCFLHPNPKKYGKPWQGRLLCSVASRLLRLKGRDLSRPF